MLQPTESFTCPYKGCGTSGLSEDELCAHCARFHGDENHLLPCPICIARKGKSADVEVGTFTWGFSSHLHHEHGPESRKLAAQHGKEKKPTYGFSLVVCQHPDGRFLLVKECCKQGWWLPGGRVDPGEDFREAAIRETLEEGGITVKLEGILKVEYGAYPDGGARQRIIFYARPVDPKQSPKSIPDYESLGAEWISWPQLAKDLKEKKKYLRGEEPRAWFRYVHNKEGPIAPISVLSTEDDHFYFDSKKKAATD